MGRWRITTEQAEKRKISCPLGLKMRAQFLYTVISQVAHVQCEKIDRGRGNERCPASCKMYVRLCRDTALAYLALPCLIELDK